MKYAKAIYDQDEERWFSDTDVVGVLDPAIPAALLGVYWLLVDSPFRSGCGRCVPEQVKGHRVAHPR